MDPFEISGFQVNSRHGEEERILLLGSRAFGKFMYNRGCLFSGGVSLGKILTT